MRKTRLLTFLFLFCLSAVSAVAQEHYTPGAVTRVTLLKIKPGKTNDLMTDLRKNMKPIYEEYKRQGVITDYRIFLNTSTASEDDWDIGIALYYKNYAALDDLFTKTDPITLKHYGSKDARQAAGQKRPEMATVVSSRLLREITLKDATQQMTSNTPQ